VLARRQLASHLAQGEENCHWQHKNQNENENNEHNNK
jgi:hypothetical protein